MHIILVSNRLAKTRSIEFRLSHLLLAAFGMLGAVIGMSLLISYFGVRHAADIKLPILQSLLMSAHQEEQQKSESFLRHNLHVMAVKLGEMQAQLMRLDALGERLSSMAGLKPQDIRFTDVPGRGGVAPAGAQARELSLQDLNRQLDLLSQHMESRTDYLGILESQLLDARLKQKLVPNAMPLEVTYNASGFGWRIDPITGQMAAHEGVDFIADVGTPIKAAAAGVVRSAEFHHAYGNMVEIDHGNDLTTRYAHASKLMVKEGELVRRGQKIAEVGTTGRSTGPHLHFEVRLKGVAQNPSRFLQGDKTLQAKAK